MLRQCYEVVEEVEDGGYSGACLERPGLHRVRQMVAAGGVDAVVVLLRDQIARGVYVQSFWRRSSVSTGRGSWP